MTMLALLAVGWLGACWKDDSDSAPSRTSAVSPRSTPSASAAVSASAGPASSAETQDYDPNRPYQGPLIGAIVLNAPIYASPARAREQLIGYMRSGGKAPVMAEPIVRANCKEGWYRLIPRGYVCGSHGSTDVNDPRVRLGITPPDLNGVVPYKYARNGRDGTPLYRAVPSRDQMEEYEPYLLSEHKGRAAKRSAAKARDEARDDNEQEDIVDETASESDARTGEAPAASEADAGEADAAPENLPWWQLSPDAGRPDIRLSDLEQGSDQVLAKRMVRGFFVAVDKTFPWNGRLWHKTTEGLVAPADRMGIYTPPTFHGVDLGGPEQPSLPLAFVLAQETGKFEYSAEDKAMRSKGTVKRYAPLPLTGKSTTVARTQYFETTKGYWVKAQHIALVQPGPPPEGLGPNEKWLDVNVTQQTLVAFEGSRAVYATLVSTGKKGATKANDHSTVLGAFRIREKHITATMDGDGAAPGENPYSIQDVPYVMYFKGSYAVHGAFWHNSFGHRMSHGCVNLAPLDARRVFLWAEPILPQGWHGIYATTDHPGTLVVVHE